MNGFHIHSEKLIGTEKKSTAALRFSVDFKNDDTVIVTTVGWRVIGGILSPPSSRSRTGYISIVKNIDPTFERMLNEGVRNLWAEKYPEVEFPPEPQVEEK
jgi:hypothetical protein